MDVSIRRFDTTLPLPEYKTPGAVAMDCVARVSMSIAPKAIGYVPLNIAVKPPADHFVLMAARSSLHKRGLMLANGVALFDEDFSGDTDEYIAILYNFTDTPVDVAMGDRITQILVLPFDRVTWNEANTLNTVTRGGIGSTGV